MALTKVVEKKWSYTLYAKEGGYILSVVCGGVAMYELNILLSPDEAKRSLVDSKYLDGLAAEIVNDPQRFASRSVVI